MGESFFININYSRILNDGDETQYTMFIDSTKISIVYELVEWIRWMFSIEYCIYLSHENSVIHELEDIQLLSKLKNFEIKPCGRSHCVHKTTYRNLLSNLNMFVSWNEMKVHKYFFDKISQINQKLTQENFRANTGMIISSNARAQEDLMDFKNKAVETLNDNFFFSDTQLSNSEIKDSSVVKNSSLIDNIESESVANGALKLKMKASFDESSIKGVLKNKLEIEQITGNSYKKSKSGKSSDKYFKPFTVGEILSNIRKDFEKQNAEVTTKKNALPADSYISEEDFNDKMTKEIFLMNEDIITVTKKRQRKRRKKSKKQDLESETFISSFVESNSVVSNLNCLKSNSALKPNHIRFDVDDEDNLVGNNCVEGSKNTENQNEFENIHEKMDDLNSLTFFKAEPEKFSVVANDNYKNLSESQPVNSSIISIENKMDCSSAVDDLIQIEEKQADLGNQIFSNINQSCSEAENVQSVSFNSDLNILVSLKENCKDSVVIKRFY